LLQKKGAQSKLRLPAELRSATDLELASEKIKDNFVVIFFNVSFCLKAEANKNLLILICYYHKNYLKTKSTQPINRVDIDIIDS
jgi:hypothetical protein